MRGQAPLSIDLFRQAALLVVLDVAAEAFGAEGGPDCLCVGELVLLFVWREGRREGRSGGEGGEAYR